MIGAAAAALPDVACATFYARPDWLPEHHPLVRTHRFLHSTRGLITLAVLAYGTHLVVDRLTPHRTGPDA